MRACEGGQRHPVSLKIAPGDTVGNGKDFQAKRHHLPEWLDGPQEKK